MFSCAKNEDGHRYHVHSGCVHKLPLASVSHLLLQFKCLTLKKQASLHILILFGYWV